MKRLIALAQFADGRRQAGFPGEAVCHFRKFDDEWKSAFGTYPWADAHHGAALCMLGDYEQAISRLRLAIANSKDDYPWAYAHLGECYRLKYSTALILEGLAIDDNAPISKEDTYNNAIENFDKAIDLTGGSNSNYAWAFAHRGATKRLKVNPKNLSNDGTKKSDPLWKEAVTDLERAANLTSLDGIASNSVYAWALAYLATLFMLKKDLKYENGKDPESKESPARKMLHYYYLATNRDPSVVVNPSIDAARYEFYAHHKYGEKKKTNSLKRAILFSQQALRESPDSASAWYFLTLSKEFLDKLDAKAETHVHPEFAETRIRLWAASALCSLAGILNRPSLKGGNPDAPKNYLALAYEINHWYTQERANNDPGLSSIPLQTNPDGEQSKPNETATESA